MSSGHYLTSVTVLQICNENFQISPFWSLLVTKGLKMNTCREKYTWYIRYDGIRNGIDMAPIFEILAKLTQLLFFKTREYDQHTRTESPAGLLFFRKRKTNPGIQETVGLLLPIATERTQVTSSFVIQYTNKYIHCMWMMWYVNVVYR